MQVMECGLWHNLYEMQKVIYVERLPGRWKIEADVRLRRNKPVTKHFNGNGYSAIDIGVSILEFIKDKSRYYRQIRELDWID